MRDGIVIEASAVEALAVAYRQALPLEASGFLLGNRLGVVTQVLPAGGSAGAAGQFALSDSEVRRARAWAEDRGLAIVAVFHSHPSGSRRPSAADRAALRHSEWPWAIVTPASRGRGGIEIALYAPGDAVPVPCELA